MEKANRLEGVAMGLNDLRNTFRGGASFFVFVFAGVLNLLAPHITSSSQLPSFIREIR